MLNFGRRIADGDTAEVLRQPDVVAAYLGVCVMALLEVADLNVRYGEIEALRGVSFSIEEGAVVTLLGSNGAGKSTTLRAISGLVAPRVGLDPVRRQADRRPRAPARSSSLGVAHVPEGRRVFPGLTVRENIMLGASNGRRLERRDSPRGGRHVRALPRHHARSPMRSAGRFRAASNRWSRSRAA